jgi:hypothetical protein
LRFYLRLIAALNGILNHVNFKPMKKLFIATIIIVLNGCIYNIAFAQFWEAANGPLTPGNATALAVSPAGELFVGAYDVEFGTAGGVFRSPVGTDSWTQSGLGDRHIITLTIDKLGNIYAGTDSGIYCSTDDGYTWAIH